MGSGDGRGAGGSEARQSTNHWRRLHEETRKALRGELDARALHEPELLSMPETMWSVGGGGGEDGKETEGFARLPRRELQIASESRSHGGEQHRATVSQTVLG